MCECEKRSEYTATLKICECDCACDCECCIERFYSVIEADPQLLQRLDKIQFAHTPLHEAAAEGKTALALEVMNLMPSLGRKLNPQGLSPLHLAVAKGHVATALALVKLDSGLARVKGKGGLTPLHSAAGGKCEMEVLAGLLVECPESMGVLNNRRQSAVHVALENKNVQAARLLVNWLVIVAKESDLSIKDAHGNTTLHVAARYCRCRELLQQLTTLVKVNKPNNYGETPLNIAIHHTNGDAEKMLKAAGASARTTRGEEHHLPRRRRRQSTMVRYLLGHHADKCAETLTRAYYFITKELTMDMRNTILVVAVLIATTTYQGVLQPPGGVYSAEGGPTTRRLAQEQGHPPGQMVMGTTKYSYFMPTNTLAFISATLIIIFVLPDRAFVVLLQACLIFMCVGYLLALNFISYYNDFSRILDIVCCCTVGVAFSLKLGYYCVKAYYNEEEWLLRRLGVMISNRKARFLWRGERGGKDRLLEMSVIRRMRQQYKLICKRVG